MRLRLSDPDRERLGCPEFLPLDIRTITNREAVGLQRLGYSTPLMFSRALAADETDYQAWTALVWLALRRSGVETDPLTLEFDVVRLAYFDDEATEPKVEPGKAPARAASTNSRRKSSTRSATSKPRSARASSTS